MRTISRGVTGAVLIAMSAIACTSESDTRSLPGQTPATATGSTNAALAASLLQEKDMIVIYRDQMDYLRARQDMGLRATTIKALHAPVVADLKKSKARDVHSFSVVNAFKAKLTTTEAETLSARPEIAAVVQSHLISLPKHTRDRAGGARGAAGGSTGQQLCNTLEPEALQVTHTAYLDPTTPSAQTTLDGNGNKITGKGVKVAWIADGLNPNDKGFIRPDGSKVFFDYQDFTGDPAGTPTGGEEAYGDASSIAAQDTPNGTPYLIDISQFVNPAHAINGPCNIRVRGMAPGASLAGFNVFSANGYTTDANFVDAIEWAVVHDGVDVLNESFGSNPVYDDTKDLISLANLAATRAGVTVVASTGDAGSAGTIGSPATASDVIAAGATTTYRVYQQTGDGIPFYNGFISSNISSISSGGFAQKHARTVDVVAPGDLGWAYCSTDSTLFTDCGSYAGTPSPLVVFGGTSEASPLIAGAAALVIQAYRSTHNNADPTPATVKSILASSAHDLGAPSDEQGAGLIDSLKAVNIAMSLVDQNGSPAPKGSGLLASPSSFNFTAHPHDILANQLDVTNTGSSFRVLQPTLEKLGAPIASGSATLTVDTVNGPTFPNVVGAARPYSFTTFNVPAGLDHLDAAIGFKGTSTSVVAFEVIDPSGKLAAYSIPQGAGTNYGHVDVVKPAAGQWKVYVRTYVKGNPASYAGPIKFTWSGERYVPAGIVFPPVAFVAPGQSAHFVAALESPSDAGDTAAAVRFGDDVGEVPITVRTLIPTSAQGGSWAGTLTGGNGRGDLPTQTFAFDVPNGLKTLGAKLNVQTGYNVAGFLVDPHGNTLSTGSTVDFTGAPAKSVELDHADPEAGRWSIVTQTVASGGQTSSPFSGAIEFDQANITAPALPDSASKKVSKATGLDVAVHIKNGGPTTRAYFADARLHGSTQVELPPPSLCSATSPTTVPGICVYNIVPTRATAAVFLAQSTVPVDLEAVWNFGGPDLLSKEVAPNTAAVQISGHELPYSFWVLEPNQTGYPFGAGGLTPQPVATDAFVQMPAFDTNVTSPAGNYWADAVNNPATPSFDGSFTIDPGQTKTLTVHIGVDDAAAVGKVVKGFISIDAWNFSDPYALGDEVISLPYEYTVKR